VPPAAPLEFAASASPDCTRKPASHAADKVSRLPMRLVVRANTDAAHACGLHACGIHTRVGFVCKDGTRTSSAYAAPLPCWHAALPSDPARAQSLPAARCPPAQGSLLHPAPKTHTDRTAEHHSTRQRDKPGSERSTHPATLAMTHTNSPAALCTLHYALCRLLCRREMQQG
jgi:hypothetical protein